MEYTKQSITIEQLASGRPLQGRCSYACVPSESARYARTPSYRATTALRSAINIQRDTKITLQSLGNEQRDAVPILWSLGSESRDAVAILRSLGSEQRNAVAILQSLGSESRDAVAILRSLGSEQRNAVAILRSLGSERQEIVTAFHLFGIALRRSRTVEPSTLSNRGYDRREHPRTATVGNNGKHPGGVPHYQQAY